MDDYSIVRSPADHDPLEEMLNKLCRVRPTKSTKYTARLVLIRGDELWFEDRQGRRWMIKRSSLNEIYPLREVVE